MRRILHAALAEPTRLAELALSSFGEADGIELELPSHSSRPAIVLAT